MTLYSTCFRSSCGSRVATGSVRATVREFSAWPLVVGRVWPEPPVVSWPAPASAPALCAGAVDSLVPGACAEEQAVSVQSATASARISAKMDLLAFIGFLSFHAWESALRARGVCGRGREFTTQSNRRHLTKWLSSTACHWGSSSQRLSA